MHTIEPKHLKALIGNQKKLENANAGTTRATFKLSNLKALIDAIEKLPGFQADDEFTHNICITFVREDLQELRLYNLDPDKRLEKQGTRDPGSQKKYSQVIPVITGCYFHLDQQFDAQEFRYLRDATGNIPCIRPGGEASGLIPPPPSGKDDDVI